MYITTSAVSFDDHYFVAWYIPSNSLCNVLRNWVVLFLMSNMICGHDPRRTVDAVWTQLELL